MIKIGIAHYGVGNLGSIQNAFTFIQSGQCGNVVPFKAYIESSPNKLKNYDKLLLPGVGAFGNAMQHLKDSEMDKAIKAFAQSGKLVLGICLGMQLLFEKSYEFGEHEGLGLLKGDVIGFHNIAPLKIPHIGWNSCIFTESGLQSPLLRHIDDKSFFYFVHSFHIRADKSLILAHCDYGYMFGAIVGKDNLLGIQAHPEKSHNVGLRLLTNFINM